MTNCSPDAEPVRSSVQILPGNKKKKSLDLQIFNRIGNNIVNARVLDQIAPRKKYIRDNSMPFFNKELSSAHKKRKQLRNRYLTKRSYQNKRLYTKERNFCVFLL